MCVCLCTYIHVTLHTNQLTVTWLICMWNVEIYFNSLLFVCFCVCVCVWMDGLVGWLFSFCFSSSFLVSNGFNFFSSPMVSIFSLSFYRIVLFLSLFLVPTFSCVSTRVYFQDMFCVFCLSLFLFPFFNFGVCVWVDCRIIRVTFFGLYLSTWCRRSALLQFLA